MAGNGNAVVRRESGVLSASTKESWGLVANKAKAIAASSVIPKEYQGRAENCLIAMEMADRTGMPVLFVMQNLHIINGRPSWSAQFLIAGVNNAGRFSPLRFRWQGTQGEDDWGCRAVAKDLDTGEELVGSLITIAMAKKEGWYSKNGSKWQSMPEQMLQYRSASFWARVHAAELGVGLPTVEEAAELPAPTQEVKATVIEALDEPETEKEPAAVSEEPELAF